MEMYVIDNGVIHMPKEITIAGEADGEWIDIPVEVFLIRHTEGWVLFDAACDPEGMGKHWPEEFTKFPYIPAKDGYLPDKLRRIGAAPEDVRYVVASHLHLDHAGCLKFFPDAEIIVSNDELRRTLHQYVLGEGLGAHMRSDVEGWLLAELNWRPLSDKTLPLLEGLTVINLGPGHSWGMIGMLVELPVSGNFLLVSDAIYSQAHAVSPEMLPGIVEDTQGYIATVKAIKKLASERNARIIYGHDLGQFQSLTKFPEGYYD